MALPLRDDTPTRRPAWAVYGLIVVSVVVFCFFSPAVLQRSGADASSTSLDQIAAQKQFLRWGAVPCEITNLDTLAHGDLACDGPSFGVTPPDKNLVLSVFSYLFIHASVAHLAGNLLFLWVFGRGVEDRLGPAGLLGLFAVSGLIALGGHVVFHAGEAVPVVGSSGAVAGIMGAALLFRPRARIFSFVFCTVLYLPAWVLLALFFTTQFFTPDSTGVAWEAHVAGMLGGFAIATVAARFTRDPLAPPPVTSPATGPERPPGLAAELPAAPPTRTG